MRIVWSGGLVSERSFSVPMSSFRSSERESQIVDRIRRGVEEGRNDAAIAASLNNEGLRPCRRSSFTAATVGKIRRRHRILTGLEKVRRSERVSGYTVREMAGFIGTDPSWIYRGISRGKIQIEKDPRYGCYL